MRLLLATALLASCGAPTNARSLDGLLRTNDRVAGGKDQGTSAQMTTAALSVPPSASDFASLKMALDRAVAPRTPAATSLASARPVVERLLLTMSCATSAKALHGLNRDRMEPETYRTVDDDLHYTAMGVASLMTHNRRQCMQVARVTELQRPTLNALSIRTYFVSPSSGEARNVITSFRLMDGVWMIDKIGWFKRS